MHVSNIKLWFVFNHFNRQSRSAWSDEIEGYRVFFLLLIKTKCACYFITHCTRGSMAWIVCYKFSLECRNQSPHRRVCVISTKFPVRPSHIILVNSFCFQNTQPYWANDLPEKGSYLLLKTARFISKIACQKTSYVSVKWRSCH